LISLSSAERCVGAQASRTNIAPKSRPT